MDIRLAQKKDLTLIQGVVEAAFSDEERAVIGTLVADLSSEIKSPPIKSLVAQVSGEVVGYVAYSPLFFKSSTTITGYILAPLAVSPEYQGRGVGSKLVSAGIDMLFEDGIDFLMVYGDPGYYGRFGFKEEIARRFVPPCHLKYPFGWLGLSLSGSDTSNVSLMFECVASLNKPELW